MDALRSPNCPPARLRVLNDGAVRSAGKYILYWMNAARRVQWNYALDRAVELASELKKPLIVLEALRCGYPYASERIHQFVLQGMEDNQAALQGTDVHYYPYVESVIGAGKGLLKNLAKDACVVVTDDCPATFLPRMVAAAATQVSVRMEAVDSNGILPLREAGKAFLRAYDFRRFLQRELMSHLGQFPLHDSVVGVELPRLRGLPGVITKRWPVATASQVSAKPRALQSLPIDHAVAGTSLRGGTLQGRQLLERFISVPDGLASYGTGRNHPDKSSTSGLSPFLHFGQISGHEVLHAIQSQEGWTAEGMGSVRSGARLGWWGMSEVAEGYLDQLITWRELGLNFATYRDDIQSFGSLPEWASNTLEEHATDSRPYLYSLQEFDAAQTHDPIWNAAQTQLRRSGRMHNYMRMLWGKKILHWSPSPQVALQVMLELNDRYALDGRDPNSYSGIFWVLGRYDRAWGPERSVFGKIRYMSSKNTRRKLLLTGYLRQWGGEDQCTLFPT